ncbi:IS1 family transposase [Sediminitomix flava]|uniref:IS1 family transposase n=1 Tax=Sediminitomix flava TaxID=379075 RepID=UPI003741F956
MSLKLGTRKANMVKKLWKFIPKNLRSKIKVYSDHYPAYQKILPVEIHETCDTKRETNHVERLNCSLRKRVSRLVRKSLSFSKKFKYHHLAIKYFIANYNLSLNP